MSGREWGLFEGWPAPEIHLASQQPQSHHCLLFLGSVAQSHTGLKTPGRAADKGNTRGLSQDLTAVLTLSELWFKDLLPVSYVQGHRVRWTRVLLAMELAVLWEEPHL